MDNVQLASWIRQLISENKLYKFYKSHDWLELRDEVLRENHYECQRCAEKGMYTRAVMVHHVNEVRKHPHLALTKEIEDKVTGRTYKNLVPLCFACHEDEHDRFADFNSARNAAKFTNVERW